MWKHTTSSPKLVILSGLKLLESTVVNRSIFLILTHLRSFILESFRPVQHPSLALLSSFLLLIPSFIFGQMETMLLQAEAIAQKYNSEVAKIPPPSPILQTAECLNTASVWLSIDLTEMAPKAFEHLANEDLWDGLREIGVQGVYLKNLKTGGRFRTAIRVDPRWGNWDNLALALEKRQITLIGDAIGKATGLGADFACALKNMAKYLGLYHLIEIKKQDWKLLPNISSSFANVPWLSLKELHKRGYVSEKSAPYVKQSSWNATAPIPCVDGKMRRWIYLKEQKEDPVINWLGPSFAGYQIATADMLDSTYQLGQKIFCIEGDSAKDLLATWGRKLGCFSSLKTRGGLHSWKQAKTDLIFDTLTPRALLHALIAEDAEVLKLTYRLFLEEKIDTKRLVHCLQPFDQYTRDYALFLAEPKRQLQYYEEIVTANALRMRLLKQDAARLKGPDPVSWPSLCMTHLPNQRDALMHTHLLLALFYAMQPGVFSFSASDLLGLKESNSINLSTPNESSLYGSLPSQMKNSCSFAMKLRNLLAVRAQSDIQTAELIDVPYTKQRSLLVLLYKLEKNHMLQMLAINFGSSPVSQSFEIPAISQTSAIDLITGLCEKKPLDSSKFQLDLPALSGKIILFQTKYFD